MTGDAEVAARDLDEERIALGGPDGGDVTDGPDQDAGQPELEAEAHGSGQRAIEDRDGAWCSAKQDRFGQGAVNRHTESRNRVERLETHRHQTSAPPPKLKNERKKLDAAKAMEIPKTIWMRRRKPPPVSPNASVRPVTMMMITATILATGPSTDSRMDCSGASQGMEEPDAWAGAVIRLAQVKAAAVAR
eukprot:jgi/Tetstr1/451702/TSEL_038738.t1